MFGLVRIGEAAKILGMSVPTVRYWSNQGRIPYVKTPGGQRLFNAELLNQIKRQIHDQIFLSVSGTGLGFPDNPVILDGEAQKAAHALEILGHMKQSATDLARKAREKLPQAKSDELVKWILDKL